MFGLFALALITNRIPKFVGFGGSESTVTIFSVIVGAAIAWSLFGVSNYITKRVGGTRLGRPPQVYRTWVTQETGIVATVAAALTAFLAFLVQLLR